MQAIDNTANKWQHITTNGLTVIPGKCELVAIVVNSKGASSNTATIYDDVAGEETAARQVGILDTTSSIGRVKYGIPMEYGINIRTATGTAPDLTVVYRPAPTISS